MSIESASGAIKGALVAALLAGAPAFAQVGADVYPFNCKPPWVPNGVGQSSDSIIRMNTVGVVAAWRCKAGPINVSVERWDHLFTHPLLINDLHEFSKDPSHVRMNATLLKWQTGDWRMDSKLREVWLPFHDEIMGLKTTSP